MDPPWENKSVKRKNEYPMFYMKRLLNLPMKQFYPKKGPKFCIVGIWVTNNPKIIKFVKESLIVKWNLQYVTSWYWLKCTNNGVPVCPFNTVNRKPYEELILCVYNPNNLPLHSSLQERRVIVSTPSTKQHSRKPSLQSIIDSLFCDIIEVSELKRLELFARNLTKGFLSWGNEVLIHQDSSFFHKKDKV